MLSLSDLLASKPWRLRHLYLILPEDKAEGGVIPLTLREEQEKFMKERHTRNFVPKARKLGMSTFIVLDYLDECLFNPQTHCAHIDFREEDAVKKLNIARLAWQHGPQHPDPLMAEIWKGLHARIKIVKDNGSCLEWSNGSKQEASMSFMGGTPRRLHVSEYGPCAAQRPEAALKIKRGSFNAVPITGIVDVETTMEGGPAGECYAIFKLACDSEGRERSPLDWRLHFFPWYNHPTYRIPGGHVRKPDTHAYFQDLPTRHGLAIPEDRQAWYEVKRAEQQEDMYTQFPSVPEECVRVGVREPIYPYVTTLRAQGRVREITPEPGLPLYTAWDLGVSDATAGWLIQPTGRDLLWLDWYEGEGHGAATVADVMRAWELRLGRRIARHYVPHDANLRDKGSGRTYLDALVQAGIPRMQVCVVPRTPDIWAGINVLRDLLPKSYFHPRCDLPRKTENGTERLSGLSCLELYKKQPPTPGGVLRSMPLHDATSHSADAARTWAEGSALGAGLYEAGGGKAPRVLVGMRG